MIESRLATKQDVEPHGLRCPYCDIELHEGDEIVSVLEGMVDDIPLTLVVCGVCGPRMSERQRCPRCDGFGSYTVSAHGCGGDEKKCGTVCPVPEEAQCDWCHGAGEMLPPASSTTNTADKGADA